MKNETVATLRHVPKEYKSLYVAAREQGWSIFITVRSSHLRWLSPDGHSTYTPKTPSCNGPAYNRIKSKLRRAGLKV